jgi:hypothetical protein
VLNVFGNFPIHVTPTPTARCGMPSSGSAPTQALDKRRIDENQVFNPADRRPCVTSWMERRKSEVGRSV